MSIHNKDKIRFFLRISNKPNFGNKSKNTLAFPTRLATLLRSSVSLTKSCNLDKALVLTKNNNKKHLRYKHYNRQQFKISHHLASIVTSVVFHMATPRSHSATLTHR